MGIHTCTLTPHSTKGVGSHARRPDTQPPLVGHFLFGLHPCWLWSVAPINGLLVTTKTDGGIRPLALHWCRSANQTHSTWISRIQGFEGLWIVLVSLWIRLYAITVKPLPPCLNSTVMWWSDTDHTVDGYRRDCQGHSHPLLNSSEGCGPYQHLHNRSRDADVFLFFLNSSHEQKPYLWCELPGSFLWVISSSFSLKRKQHSCVAVKPVLPNLCFLEPIWVDPPSSAVKTHPRARLVSVSQMHVLKEHPEATEKVNVEYVRLWSKMLLFWSEILFWINKYSFNEDWNAQGLGLGWI